MKFISPATSNDALPQTVARLPRLDVLRGVAVTLVLFCHAGVPPRSDAGFLYRAIRTLLVGGWVGVDLFFVLSGFLVSGILFRQYIQTGGIRPRHFLIRRGFKIYPAFWLLILVTTIVIWKTQRVVPLKHVIVQLLFFQNYLPELFIYSWSLLFVHTWSLAVEEHCYLALCVLLSTLAYWNRGRRNPFFAVPWIVGGISIIALSLRLTNKSPLNGETFMWFVAPTHLRFDTFFAGVLLGYYYYFRGSVFHSICMKYRWICLFVGTVCLLPVFFLDIASDRIVTTWMYCINTLGSCLLLMWALGTREPLGRISGLVAVIGRYSYSIYLWHILLGVQLSLYLMQAYRIPGGLLAFLALYFGISINAGILLSWLVERPALYLRELWFPDTPQQAANPAEAMPEKPTLAVIG